MRRPRLLRLTRSTRIRVMAVLAAMVTSAALINMAVLSHLLTQEARDRVLAELGHEKHKFATHVAGLDTPALLSRPDAASRVLRGYIAQAVPEEGEALFSVIDGRADVRTRADIGVRLDRNVHVIDRAARARDSVVDRVEVDGRSVDYAVIPLELRGGDSRGALVVVESVPQEQERLDSTLQALVVMTLASLLVVMGLAWWVAGRMIRPLRRLRTTAEDINESNLSARVPVLMSGGDDVAGVAHTINHMLDRLEGSFTAQREFLDDVAHDLRTPLTVIRGHLDLARPADPEEAESRVSALAEARRMSRLIDDLLLLASASSPQFLTESEVDLIDVATGVLAKAARLADREWYAAGTLEMTVKADEQRLVQAWLELVVNAIKHTEDGQPVGVGVRAGTSGGVELFVEDSGPGVPVADRTRIFDRAVGADEGTTRSTGLGLSIVATIARAHSGSVRVDPSTGRGARFIVELPAWRVTGWGGVP